MKRYPKYKDSRIEWIGEFPEAWKISKIKFLAEYINGYAFKPTDWSDGGLKIIRIQNLTNSDASFNRYSGELEEKYRIEKGAILFSWSASLGIFVWDEQDAWLNQHIFKVIPYKSVIVKKFYFYQAKWFTEILEKSVHGSTMQHLTKDNFGGFEVSLPPLPEQQAIANYLDRKTHLIDTLIENKQKLIDLLKEQRVAIINQAVTKGLNPNVKLKDSGIEWLGEIPEQWGIARLKFISNIKYGLGQPPRALEGGLPIIRATNIKEGKISPDDLLYVDPKDVPYDRDPILKENDIIVVRSGAYTGDSAIIPREYEGAVAGYDMVACVHKANPEYIAYSLLSHSILHNQIDLCRFRAAQPHLNAEELGDTLVFLPPEDEQKMIVEFIKHESEMIVSINQNLEELIKFLKEYRTALISEVVTGKIDVRDSGIPEVMPS